jgi:bacteriocin-like protein
MNNFETISDSTLATITGGKATSAKDTQLTTMLTDISKSIKDAAEAKNKSGSDPTQMMMMMMMMGGMGGGGSQQVAAAPPPEAPAPAVVRVNVR